MAQSPMRTTSSGGTHLFVCTHVHAHAHVHADVHIHVWCASLWARYTDIIGFARDWAEDAVYGAGAGMSKPTGKGIPQP